MPRSKPRSVIVTSSASGASSRSNNHSTTSTSGSINRSRITIKPFSKPPSLPPNYYETSTQELLDATRFLKLLNASSSATSTTPVTHNLQTSNTTVVHLVSHHLGVRLYGDLRASLQRAAQLVLPDSTALLDDLLPHVCQQYH